MTTIKVVLVYRYFETTPNAYHFDSGYDALFALQSGTVGSWNEAILTPGRRGESCEKLTPDEFFNWVTAE